MQGVFTYLIDNLGVKDVQFEEIISLDADTLKQQRYKYHYNTVIVPQLNLDVVLSTE